MWTKEDLTGLYIYIMEHGRHHLITYSIDRLADGFSASQYMKYVKACHPKDYKDVYKVLSSDFKYVPLYLSVPDNESDEVPLIAQWRLSIGK